MTLLKSVFNQFNMAKTYKFFWGGIYSNFYPCKFHDGVKYYNCNEQYFMSEKAALFEDSKIRNLILETTDPKVMKKLGREVKGFDPVKWNDYKEEVMESGLRFKFTQNPELKKALLEEDCDLFVEASPFDKIWGIGLNEAVAKTVPPDEWPGQNLLGKLLTQLREELKNGNNN